MPKKRSGNNLFGRPKPPSDPRGRLRCTSPDIPSKSMDAFANLKRSVNGASRGTNQIVNHRPGSRTLDCPGENQYWRFRSTLSVRLLTGEKTSCDLFEHLRVLVGTRHLDRSRLTSGARPILPRSEGTSARSHRVATNPPLRSLASMRLRLRLLRRLLRSRSSKTAGLTVDKTDGRLSSTMRTSRS